MYNTMSGIDILLVDDDSFSLELTIMELQNIGQRAITTANSGKMALDKLAKKDVSYDLIMLDLNMPNMDGVEFMRYVSDSDFTGGIILLSGEDQRMLETAMGLAKSHQLNILGAIGKPLKPEFLKGMLESFKHVSKQSSSHAPQQPITIKELRSGISGSEDNQIKLAFQPKVNVKTGEIASVETLARWWHAERGLLGPAAFIPLAEETGLIDTLTTRIYQQAILQSSEWTKNGRGLIAAINFSVNSFASRKFCDSLVEIALKHGVNPGEITLEITETQAMTIAVDCLEALMSMRLKRFNLSIDDFGVGNSSMAQLKSIPFNELKIDRAFVNGAANDAGALAILETSIDLAKRLNMKIVAEGAETKADWDLVERLGCDYVQGFYCARPMQNDDLMGFLDSWSGPH